MKELSKLQLCVYNIGGLLLVAGIIVPLFSGATAVALYLYLLGALMFSSMQVLQKYEGKNITLKRLRRQQILGALMLLLAGGLMACSVYGIPPLCKGEWGCTSRTSKPARSRVRPPGPRAEIRRL